jgi:UDPglucose 6-dehydrogenase
MKSKNHIKPSVIGLGKLGLPLAAVIASSGYETIGIDYSEKLINNLNSSEFDSPEPKLLETIKEFKNQLVFTSNYFDAIQTNISFVIVPTPSLNNMNFDNSYVVEAINSLLKVWVNSEEDKTIVIVSTVMPGTCQDIIDPIIKVWLDDNKFKHKINLVYAPEFIALGTVINNLRYPDMTLVGCKNPDDAKVFIEVMGNVTLNNPEISIINLREAEIVKILVNCFVTMKISFANFIGEIAAQFIDVDQHKVAKALSLDTRIGNKYLRPGLGFAGPCFPRDNNALIAFSNDLNVVPELAIATDRINVRQPSRIAENILFKFPVAKHFGIIGLAYKAKTNITEASQTVEIANILAGHDKKVLVFDRQAFDPNILQSKVKIAENISDFEKCDLVIVSKEHEEEVNSLRINKQNLLII